jgi:hypothetical protein
MPGGLMWMIWLALRAWGLRPLYLEVVVSTR